MRVNKIGNYGVSFGKALSDEQSKGLYFKWISQNQANNILLLTKGREERNGKFTLAKDALGLTSFAVGVAAILFATSKKHTASLVSLIIGSLALIGSSFVDNFNKNDALKTAQERGFTLESVNRGKISSVEKTYSETEEVYNNTVKR